MATMTQATTGTTRSPARVAEPDQVVVMPRVGWDGYEAILRIRGEAKRPRIIYLDGDLVFMSPGHNHERDADRLHAVVVEVTVGLRLAMHFARSTTYRRRKGDAGIEPDQSYYLANASHVRNKVSIDLEVDPPPDLAIEVVYSHSAGDAIEVAGRLGIPEVWMCLEAELKFLVLGVDGRYAESATSLAFPFLGAAEVLDWVRKPEGEDASDSDWVFELRQWVRDVLVPRAAGRANEG